MEERMENSVSAETSLSASRHHDSGVYKDDEINLVDLWLVMVKQWKWIAAFVVVSVVASSVYLVLATPLYEAESILLGPDDRSIHAMNIPKINEIDISEEKERIYHGFLNNLKSRSLRWRFFMENNLFFVLSGEDRSSAESVFRRKFQDPLRIKEGARDEAGFVFVTFQGKDRELIADWVNDFIQLAAGNTIDNYIDGVRAKIMNQKEMLHEQIRIEREIARQLRLDRLAMLAEQVAIARELNIISRDDAPLRSLESSNFGVAISTFDEPLYLRGVKDLTAEKEILAKREDDDPFIEGLRDKQIELDRLESGLRKLESARADSSAFRLDQKAIPPEQPVHPKKRLVMALSLVLGCMLGVFAAFFRSFIASARRPQ